MIARFGDQGAGFGIGQLVFVEVAADAGAEDFRFADVDDFPGGVFVQIHSGRERQLRDFFPEEILGQYTLIELCHAGGWVWSVCAVVVRWPRLSRHLLRRTTSKEEVQLPPEEDKAANAPKEYRFNPLQSKKEMSRASIYFKKGDYRAAAGVFAKRRSGMTATPKPGCASATRKRR